LARERLYVTIVDSPSKGIFFNCPMTTPVTFLRQTYDEMQKVVWPTRNDVIRLTLIVITMSLFVGIYIGGLDYIFTKITELIVK